MYLSFIVISRVKLSEINYVYVFIYECDEIESKDEMKNKNLSIKFV